MEEHHRALTPSFAGIDYGSKMAGTTVIAMVKKERVSWLCSRKKQDADAMILEWSSNWEPELIFLDAPLSLPGVYTHLPGKSDYFYRTADRELNAMSPLFLGGLTARAMQLAQMLRVGDRQIIEVYPAPLATQWGLKEKGYKKSGDPSEILLSLLEDARWKSDIPGQVTWHMVDALLAALIGRRFLSREAQAFGDPQEGQIWV